MTEARARETRAKVNSKTAGHAVLQRPWEVGLHKALQKPCETLSKYIKDTVCSSSPLLFLLPSSLGPFWRPLSPYVPPEDIFFLLYTSAVCFFIQSFVQTFFFGPLPLPASQPSFFFQFFFFPTENQQCWRSRLKVPSKVGEQVVTTGQTHPSFWGGGGKKVISLRNGVSISLKNKVWKLFGSK